MKKIPSLPSQSCLGEGHPPNYYEKGEVNLSGLGLCLMEGTVDLERWSHVRLISRPQQSARPTLGAQ